jgi:peptidoglycan/xylan/chitin deacetylase (PgdA/CDA1 family)
MSVARTASKVAFTAADALFPKPAGPRILIYHQVGSGLGRQMEVTTDDFVRQLDWLNQNREIVAFDEAVARWDEPGSDHLVAFTFDDGYVDTYTTAYPEMKRRGIPFLVYLATNSIETGSPLGPPERADPLSWDQIREMMDSGLATIGAHTHRHADLRALPPLSIEEELATSDALIEQRLGIRPAHFAYPWGYWSPQAAELVNARYGTAAVAGSPRPPSTLDKHVLHRYPVQLSDGFRFFPSRLRGGLRAEEQLRRWLKGYSGP